MIEVDREARGSDKFEGAHSELAGCLSSASEELASLHFILCKTIFDCKGN